MRLKVKKIFPEKYSVENKESTKMPYAFTLERRFFFGLIPYKFTATILMTQKHRDQFSVGEHYEFYRTNYGYKA